MVFIVGHNINEKNRLRILQKTYENLCSILEITKSDVNITDDIKLIETLVDIIVEHRHSFYDGIDTEEVFSVLLYVMFHLKQKNFKTFESLMRKFCEGWCSVNMNLEESINAENNVASFSRINLKNKLTRIKVLKMLYGLLEFSEFGYYLLINMIQFAMKHNVYNYLRFTCNDLETWVACTVISDEEKRNLINIVYPELLKLNDVNMAIKIFNLLFSTYPKNSNRELITRDVVKLTFIYLLVPQTLDTHVILQDKNIKEYCPDDLIKFINNVIKSTESIPSLEEFLSKYSTLLNHLESNDEKICLYSKMKHLKLLSLCKKNNSISYECLMVNLKIEQDDLEEFIMDAMERGFIHGKMNQLTQNLNIESYKSFYLDSMDLKHMQKNIQGWIDNMDSLIVYFSMSGKRLDSQTQS